jgi:hypothetical protein
MPMVFALAKFFFKVVKNTFFLGFLVANIFIWFIFLQNCQKQLLGFSI